MNLRNLNKLFSFDIISEPKTIDEIYKDYTLVIVYDGYKCILVDTETLDTIEYDSVKKCRKEQFPGLSKKDFYDFFDEEDDDRIIESLENILDIKITKLLYQAN